MRSSGPVRASTTRQRLRAKANDEIVVMAMIETKEGLANLEKICATRGSTPCTSARRPLVRARMAPRATTRPGAHRHVRQIRDAATSGIKAVMHCASAAFAPRREARLRHDHADVRSRLDDRRARRQLDDLKAATA